MPIRFAYNFLNIHHLRNFTDLLCYTYYPHISISTIVSFRIAGVRILYPVGTIMSSRAVSSVHAPTRPPTPHPRPLIPFPTQRPLCLDDAL